MKIKPLGILETLVPEKMTEEEKESLIKVLDYYIDEKDKIQT